MSTRVSQRAAGERVARGQGAHSARRDTTTDSRDAALVQATPDDAPTAAVTLDPAGVARLPSGLGSTGALRRLVELHGTRTPELLADMRSALVDQIETAFEEAHAAVCDCGSSKVRDRITTDIPSQLTTDDPLNQRGPAVAARRIT